MKSQSRLTSLKTALLDFFFPSLCLSCKALSSTPFFCPSCWEECAPLDPLGRCLQCFVEEEEGICRRCREGPHLPFTRAFVFEPSRSAGLLVAQGNKEEAKGIAAFALYQWARLGWPIPEAIVPLPKMRRIAASFAAMIGAPCLPLLSEEEEGWECDAEAIEEEKTLLLFDRQTPLSSLQAAVAVLAEAFPKKIFVLSLFPDGPFPF